MKEKINLIGISGKINSGKDLVGKIIQYLVAKSNSFNSIDCNLTFNEFTSRTWNREVLSNWTIKKYADKLKDIVCILIGCTRKQLEDKDFKNKELGKEWKRFYDSYAIDKIIKSDIPTGNVYATNENYTKAAKWNIVKTIPTSDILTPRKLLQQLGTDVCKQIHPNIWVNGLFANYKDIRWINKAHIDFMNTGKFNKKDDKSIYPNWIITDVRFPNELEAIKDRNGIVIRIERGIENRIKFLDINEHEVLKNKRLIKEHKSETALDDYIFDEIINNNGTIKELIKKIEIILIKYNIL